MYVWNHNEYPTKVGRVVRRGICIEMDDWDSYFAAVECFLVNSERQYGVCNRQYTNYAMEQLEFIEVTCCTLITVISQIFPGTLCDLLVQLLTCVTIDHWK